MLGTIVSVGLGACATGAAGAWMWWLRRPQRSSHRWFRLLPMPQHWWAKAHIGELDSVRFVEALGIIPDATDPPCSVPSEPVDFYLLGSRTADQAAMLLGSSRQTLVRVPERRARKVPFAAVACGAIAIECMGPGDLVSSPFDPRRPIPLHPPAPWLLGLGTSGEPVFVNPIPGATIAVTGPDAEMLAASAPTDHPFLSAPLFLSDGDATAFRDAYSPHVCRLVVSPPADGSIPVDMVVDSHGWIEHCGATIRFTPMQSSPARGSTCVTGSHRPCDEGI